MKLLTLLLLFVLVADKSNAQFKPADNASTLKFTIKNLGFDVDGTLGGFDGKINFDPQNLAVSGFDVTINVATINTDNSLRDGHLKDNGFFDEKNYPQIRLTSSQIIPADKNGGYVLSGLLTIKGKSKPISFPFKATPIADGYNFKGEFTIKRKDFGVGGTSTVADELKVMLNVNTRRLIREVSK